VAVFALSSLACLQGSCCTLCSTFLKFHSSVATLALPLLPLPLLLGCSPGGHPLLRSATVHQQPVCCCCCCLCCCNAALVVIGSRAVLVLDCSAILSQQQPPNAAAAVASTVGLFDLRILQQQQQQQRLKRLDLPCWLGKCLLPAESVVLAAGLREESSGGHCLGDWVLWT
jgi:hypothetical protein